MGTPLKKLKKRKTTTKGGTGTGFSPKGGFPQEKRACEPVTRHKKQKLPHKDGTGYTVPSRGICMGEKHPNQKSNTDPPSLLGKRNQPITIQLAKNQATS